MNKKSYLTPDMTVVMLSEQQQLLAGTAQTISGNSGLQMGGGGNGVARGRESYDWDDEE